MTLLLVGDGMPAHAVTKANFIPMMSAELIRCCCMLCMLRKAQPYLSDTANDKHQAPHAHHCKPCLPMLEQQKRPNTAKEKNSQHFRFLETCPTCRVTAALAARLRAYSKLRSVLARHCCASRAATAADVSSRICRNQPGTKSRQQAQIEPLLNVHMRTFEQGRILNEFLG